MVKILFLIHDLGQGGAEKVLVNLVNNMNKEIFDVYVTAIFGGGVNEQFLDKSVHYSTIFNKPFSGNSQIFKLFTPSQLHRLFIKEHYDIEVSYLEGPSARIISGCENASTKLISWIHSNHFSQKEMAFSFRNFRETIKCYSKFDRIVCVSQYMKHNFCHWVNVEDKCSVVYNTVESKAIQNASYENISFKMEKDVINLISVGTLKPVKGFDRLLRIVKRLIDDNYRIHLYLLGKGPLYSDILHYVETEGLSKYVTLLGYDTNPYKYVSKSDLFVCSSHSEGFSTAVTEALIVGTPVCTVDVSGMRELLGSNNEYGIITNNDEDSLYRGIKGLISNPLKLEHYRKQAEERGKDFRTEQTVAAAQDLFLQVLGKL